MLTADILEHFDRTYAVDIAKTEPEIRAAQLVRHEVFRVERQLFPSDGTHGPEIDRFDANSHHLLLRRRSDAEVIGTVRIVLPDRSAPLGSLPIHHRCARRYLDSVPMETMGEVSRLAVAKGRRDSRSTSDMALKFGLIRALWQESSDLGLTHLCAMTAPGILRMLSRFGIHFEPAGPLIELFGPRQPCIADIAATARRVRRECPVFFGFADRIACSRREPMRMAA